MVFPGDDDVALTPPGRSRVSRETQEKLEQFVALVKIWTPRINLVSPRDATQIWARHIADSLQLVRLCPPIARSGIDLGSGAGFPGLVLAIATNIEFTLVEADRRKSAFLREAVTTLGLRTRVVNTRAENVTISTDLVVARALAPLTRLLALAQPLLAGGGSCLFLKGRTVAAELDTAHRSWEMSVEQFPSLTQSEGVVLRIANLKRRARSAEWPNTPPGHP